MYDFSKLIGKTLSILLTGKREKKETYMGTLEEVEEDFVVLKTFPSSTFQVDKFIIRISLIESVWVYKDNKTYEQKA